MSAKKTATFNWCLKRNKKSLPDSYIYHYCNYWTIHRINIKISKPKENPQTSYQSLFFPAQYHNSLVFFFGVAQFWSSQLGRGLACFQSRPINRFRNVCFCNPLCLWYRHRSACTAHSPSTCFVTRCYKRGHI